MLSRLFAAAPVILALTLAACGGASTAASGSAHRATGLALVSRARPTRIYRVRLSGTARTLSGAPRGAGDAIIAFHGDSVVCWRFAHLHGFTNATVADMHAGMLGQAGSVVEPLSTAPRLHHQGCVAISPSLSRTIWSTPSRYYVNIHSVRYPAGAVRAQL